VKEGKKKVKFYQMKQNLVAHAFMGRMMTQPTDKGGEIQLPNAINNRKANSIT
jgi:hypothetical protein